EPPAPESPKVNPGCSCGCGARCTCATALPIERLEAIKADLNAKHFKNRVVATIEWGAGPASKKPRESIIFGSYWRERGISRIRIHPALAPPWVPEDFLRHVVRHEMLHAFLRCKRGEHPV